ncbi:hypothetical protein [Planctomyces sp. SH-PL62]|uniref:hypothetical protein n=1 Tax=Planctomyces sp. SH-PL62 TaxID=1636152 RepID=UPI00078E3F6B|nr:hypothetical protein [Planctomyces sp. SH-PL62]AMV38286.1 hypothetical protein VT85_12665 [Planctomyces sp. SH-PL62]
MPLKIRSSLVKRSLPVAALAVWTAALAGAAAFQAPAQAPYIYGYGPQGLGYYAVPGVVPAPAVAPRLTVPTQARPSAPAAGRSVGPGSRNWATGNRVPSHRPWLRSRS